MQALTSRSTALGSGETEEPVSSWLQLSGRCWARGEGADYTVTDLEAVSNAVL